MALVLVALVSPVDRLAEQLFFMHMTQHLLLLDLAPILVLLGLTKVILRPATRRLVRLEHAAGPLAHPVFAIGAVRRRSCGSGTSRRCTTRRSSTRSSTCSSTSRSASRAACTGGTCCRRSARASASAGWARSSTWSRRRLLVGLLGIGLAFAPDAIYDFYERQPGYWGISPGTDQAIGGLIMATEQSIVMGIALVYLFVRALAESRPPERARGALRRLRSR